MKILLYAPNYLPATRYGGPVRSAHGLARGLVGLGHEVTVFTTNVDGPGRLDVLSDRPVDRDGVRVRYFPVAPPRRIYCSPAMARAVDAAIGTFDAVHVNGMFLWPGPRIARAAIRAGKPLVVSPRGMLVPELIAGKSVLAKRVWIRLLERRGLAAARAIHVTSEAEAEGVRRLGLDQAPLAVIGNGVERPSVLPGEEEVRAIWGDVPRNRRVAFLARLDWTKGLDLAIHAVRALPRAVLLIAGPDQIGLRARLEPELARVDGSLAGRFLGSLDGAAKWALLAGADVLIAPSLHESFGMSVAEALAVGTPVVATPGVGAAAILKRLDPACVVPREETALAAALARLLGDPARRFRLGRASQTVMAETYSWSEIARQMAVLYQTPPQHEVRG